MLLDWQLEVFLAIGNVVHVSVLLQFLIIIINYNYYI